MSFYSWSPLIFLIVVAISISIQKSKKQ
ncbi:Protein of unknown function [Bacillus mobilis]|nr:Protein of unknown function [Bacillus mobilis]